MAKLLLAFRLSSRIFAIASKEVDHGRADLGRALLLGPMSTARQHHRWSWNERRLAAHGLLKGNGDKHVALADV